MRGIDRGSGYKTGYYPKPVTSWKLSMNRQNLFKMEAAPERATTDVRVRDTVIWQGKCYLNSVDQLKVIYKNVQTYTEQGYYQREQ